MSEKSQREKLTEEHREHRQKIARLQEEYAPSRDVDAEYQDHLRRIDAILGPGEETIVDGRRTV